MRPHTVCIINPYFDITAAALAKLFMEEIILKFGMCAVVVVDDRSNFKGTDRSSHDKFIKKNKTSQYAWNSAQIDNTEIPRSLAEI